MTYCILMSHVLCHFSDTIKKCAPLLFAYGINLRFFHDVAQINKSLKILYFVEKVVAAGNQLFYCHIYWTFFANAYIKITSL